MIRIHAFRMAQLLLALIALSTATGLAQDFPFQSTYGSSQGEVGAGMIITADGGTISVGTQNDPLSPPGESNIFIVKTNSCGVRQWSRYYDIGTIDIGNRIRQTSDGEYIVLGNSERITGCSERMSIVLMKINSTGGVRWAQSYSTSDGAVGEDLQVDNAGDFIIAGTVIRSGGSVVDMLLMVTNPAGGVLWQKAFDTGGNDHLLGCAFGLNNNLPTITAVGFRPAGGTHSFEAIIVRVDKTSGILLSNFPRIYGREDLNVEARAVVQCANGDLAIAGYIRTLAGDGQAYLLRTNASGGYVSDLALNAAPEFSTEEFVALQERPNGNIIATGNVTDAPEGFGGTDMHVVEVSSALTPISQTYIGGGGFDMGTAIATNGSVNSWMVAGTTSSFGLGIEDLYLVRQLPDGNSGCNYRVVNLPALRPMVPSYTSPVSINQYILPCEPVVEPLEHGGQRTVCSECFEDNAADQPEPEISSIQGDVHTMEIVQR